MLRESEAFEQEVRRIARELFPRSGGYSAVIMNGRERDGIIDDGETIHIIEATCQPKKLKAEQDLDKSIELKKEIQRQYTDRNFKIWFVTQRDPTADQEAVVQKAKSLARCPVIGLSLAAFAQRLVDARGYLMAREKYPFGSVRSLNPAVVERVPEGDFIALDMVRTSDSTVIGPDALGQYIAEYGGLHLITGDFGAGKSMTTRHIFRILSDKILLGSALNFPVFLNLRDHVGQDDPASALYDHARRIGFAPPEGLVRAWRAGFVHLFLDGFDEISSSRFRSDVRGLRGVRFRAMKLLREFIEGHPKTSAGLVITGRQNYFGSLSELREALGLSSNPAPILSLTDFTTEQVQSYLKRMGLSEQAVPYWLPSRPLLLGYLAVKGAFGATDVGLAEMSRAEGWDYLLDRICEREGKQIEALGGDSKEVRHYIERLATRARSTTSGRGPIPTSELDRIFRQVFPSTPDEAAQQLLLRMAGLTTAASGDALIPSAPDQEDAREFIDDDFVNAARAGDLVRFINDPYNADLIEFFSDTNCTWLMNDLGVEVAVHKTAEITPGKIYFALKRAANEISAGALALDLLEQMKVHDRSIGLLRGRQETITIRNAYIEEFEFCAGADLTWAEFRECIFERVTVDRQDGAILGPRMVDCVVGQAFGVVSRDDIPGSIIDDLTTIDTYLMVTDIDKEKWKHTLPVGVRVLLASLRKLFVQQGRARKENAFPRGLDDSERPYVPNILALLQKYEFAFPQRMGGPPLWVSNRARAKEALTILHAPQESNHDILKEAREL